ncbi:MAG: class IV adenylate cyclase [Bacilli bacterium]|nr:class IV adenylate cyclase [Bacilli bacterium]
MTEKESTLGERLLKARKEKKLSQAELGEKIFVSDKTISSWESNRTVPDLDTLAKISVLLEVRITDLLYGNNLRNDIETEIRIKLSDIEYKNLKLVLDNNGKFLKEIHQKDTYYSPKFRDFLAHEYPYEWLRIGQRGNQIIVNYKHWYPEGAKINTHCDEYEVEIDDATNMDKIFKVLDLEEIAVVDKNRITYSYLEKYEIALDTVENLGYFVEIEVKKYEQEPLEEYERLLKTAKDLHLNLNNIDRRGYPYHIIDAKKVD